MACELSLNRAPRNRCLFVFSESLKGEDLMDETKYRCEECGEVFSSELEWEQHNRKVHSRYICLNCHETFNEEKEFESHNLKVHPEPQNNSR
jgi:transposase-like protein